MGKRNSNKTYFVLISVTESAFRKLYDLNIEFWHRMQSLEYEYVYQSNQALNFNVNADSLVRFGGDWRSLTTEVQRTTRSNELKPSLSSKFIGFTPNYLCRSQPDSKTSKYTYLRNYFIIIYYCRAFIFLCSVINLRWCFI